MTPLDILHTIGDVIVGAAVVIMCTGMGVIPILTGLHWIHRRSEMRRNAAEWRGICPRCRYENRRQPSVRCPECGGPNPLAWQIEYRKLQQTDEQDNRDHGSN